MKKTLLTLAFAIPLFGFSQAWEFNGSTFVSQSTPIDGWTKTACSIGVTATSLTLSGNASTSNNPVLTNNLAGVNADTNKVAVITLKSTGPDYLRFSFVSSLGGTVNVNNEITNNDTEYKTYYFNATNTGWSNTRDVVNFAFKIYSASAAAGATFSTTASTLFADIDRIAFVPISQKNSYEFVGGDSEGWNSLFPTVKRRVDSGVLTVDPVAGQQGKIVQDAYTVDGINNKYLHIVYKNNSSLNNQLRLNFKSALDNYVSTFGTNINISTSMTGYDEIIVDLSTIVDGNSASPTFGQNTWISDIKDIQLAIRDTNNANLSSAGSIQFDKIVFNNTNATLSTGDVSKAKNLLQVYVSENTLNFRNANVSKATIFNMNGQLLKDAKVQNNTVDVSNLKAGVYMVKAVAQDNSETVTKFIKK